ncbi:MAG: hypothetical protein AAFX99_16400 [Myxococcota bacterium]
MVLPASSCASAFHEIRVEPNSSSTLAVLAAEARPVYPAPVIVHRKKFRYKKVNLEVTLDLGVESITPHFKGALKVCGDPPKALRKALRKDSLEVRQAIRDKRPQSVPVGSRYHPVGQIQLNFQTRVNPSTNTITLDEVGLELLEEANALDADILILTRGPIRQNMVRGHMIARGDLVFTAYQLDCSPPAEQ